MKGGYDAYEDGNVCGIEMRVLRKAEENVLLRTERKIAVSGQKTGRAVSSRG